MHCLFLVRLGHLSSQYSVLHVRSKFRIQPATVNVITRVVANEMVECDGTTTTVYLSCIASLPMLTEVSIIISMAPSLQHVQCCYATWTSRQAVGKVEFPRVCLD